MKGIGIDILEIDRIQRSLNEFNPTFKNKHFTQNEIVYCERYANSAPHYAGHFCAKEAVVKALGTGFTKQVNFLNIEIFHDSMGAPQVQFVNLQEKPKKIIISISHCRSFATAMAVWVE